MPFYCNRNNSSLFSQSASVCNFNYYNLEMIYVSIYNFKLKIFLSFLKTRNYIFYVMFLLTWKLPFHETISTTSLCSQHIKYLHFFKCSGIKVSGFYLAFYIFAIYRVFGVRGFEVFVHLMGLLILLLLFYLF